MNESPATGSTDQFRKSDFVSATETLAGKTRSNPAELILARPVFCNGVISIDGKQEDGVPAAVLETASGHEMPLRMRLNATKRRMLAKASGTNQMKEWAPLKLKLRLYQTVDKGPGKGSPVTDAIGMDVLCQSTGQWLRYYDFQQRAGRHYVEQSGMDDNWRIGSCDPVTAPTQPAEPAPTDPVTEPVDHTNADDTIRGQWFGDGDARVWVGQVRDGATGDLYWVDATGARYDEDKDGWSAKGNMPSYNKDMTFRAKRGAAKLPSEPVATPPLDTSALDGATTMEELIDAFRAADNGTDSVELMDVFELNKARISKDIPL